MEGVVLARRGAVLERRGRGARLSTNRQTSTTKTEISRIITYSLNSGAWKNERAPMIGRRESNTRNSHP